MAALFPQAAACQENVTGPIEIPDHVLVRQTIADTLHEALDVDGVRALLERMESGEVTVHCCDTTEPSVLAHEILTAAAVRVPRRRGAPEPPHQRGAAPARAARSTSRRSARSSPPRSSRCTTRSRPSPTTRRRPPRPAQLARARPGPRRVAAQLWDELRRARSRPGRSTTTVTSSGARPSATTTRAARSRGDEAAVAARAARPPRDLRGHHRRRARGRDHAAGVAGRRRPRGARARRLRAAGPLHRRGDDDASGSPAGCSPACTRTRAAPAATRTQAVTAQDFMRFLLRWQHVAPGTQLARRGRARSPCSTSSRGSRPRRSPGSPSSSRAACAATSPSCSTGSATTAQVGWLRLTPRPARRRRRAGRAAVEGHADLGGLPRRHPAGCSRPRAAGTDPPEPTIGATAEILEVLRERGALLRDRARRRRPAGSPTTSSARCGTASPAAAHRGRLRRGAQPGRRRPQARAAPALAAAARRARPRPSRPAAGRSCPTATGRARASTATSWPRPWPSCCCAAGA